MSVIKALCVAFSIYSKVPMPSFKWEDEELRLHLIFFPFVGALIGGLVCLWYMLASRLGVGAIAYTLIGAAIPLIVTGGFHVDGFMDTMDACKSYKSREDKLLILKDPHIGAFSVIMLASAGLLYVAAYSGIDGKNVIVFALGFVISRALSAIAVIRFPKAKREGMVSTFSESCSGQSQTVVLIWLVVESVFVAIAAIVVSPIAGSVMIATALCSFIMYYYKAKGEFGGITGDTAGYYVTVTEVGIAVALYVVSLL